MTKIIYIKNDHFHISDRYTPLPMNQSRDGAFTEELTSQRTTLAKPGRPGRTITGVPPTTTKIQRFRRKEPKVQDIYLRLLVNLSRFLARERNSSFNQASSAEEVVHELHQPASSRCVWGRDPYLGPPGPKLSRGRWHRPALWFSKGREMDTFGQGPRNPSQPNQTIYVLQGPQVQEHHRLTGQPWLQKLTLDAALQ